MADTLTISSLSCNVQGTVANDTVLVPVSVPLSVRLNLTLSDGVAAGSADKIYVARRTLAGAATENLDLAGTLLDPLGQTITFVEITAMVFIIQPTTAAEGLEIGGAAVAPFINWITSFGTITTDLPRLKVRNGPAGGFFAMTATDATGWPVTPATGDILKVTNMDAAIAITYDVVIIGRSA